MQLFNRHRPPATAWTPQGVALVGALWTALVCNWPLWRTLWSLEAFSPASRALLTAVLACGTTGLLVVLTAPLCWHRSVRSAVAVVVLCGAAIAHFIGSYGVVISPSMMRNVVQTDVREVRDLFGLGLAASLIMFGALPMALLWRVPLVAQGWRTGLWRNGTMAVVGLLVCVAGIFLAFADFASLMRGRPDLRYMVTPLNGFYSLAMQAATPPALKTSLPPVPSAGDAHLALRQPGSRPPLLMLVIGETARADRLGLNGYARPTTPQLEKLDVVSFADVTACGTDTASALPCMLSLLDREAHLALKQPQENLLDALHRAGLAVLWIDNQSGCKGLCDRVPNVHASVAASGAPVRPDGLCHGQECFDEALLHGLDQRLAALDAARRARGVVLVLHQMGSHGPAYFLRTPDAHKPFQPECRSVSLRSCEPAALNNAFDNSIAYTDHVLARAIAWLGQQAGQYSPALLYVSDHGESLGERGLYLHGMPFRLAPHEQTHVPMVAWWPPSTASAQGVPLACVRERRSEPLTHSHLAHTVLAWMGVQTGSLQPQLDAFAPCRLHLQASAP